MSQAITHYTDGRTFKDLSDLEKRARTCTRCDYLVENMSVSGICKVCNRKARALAAEAKEVSIQFDEDEQREVERLANEEETA